MIAALMTGVSCNDPTGDHPEENFSKRSFSESGQGLRGLVFVFQPRAPT